MNLDKVVQTCMNHMESLLPAGAEKFREDLTHNMSAVLREALTRLDLVTREEFEVQQNILSRTRQKLQALEQRLDELEKLSKSI